MLIIYYLQVMTQIILKIQFENVQEMGLLIVHLSKHN